MRRIGRELEGRDGRSNRRNEVRVRDDAAPFTAVNEISPLAIMRRNDRVQRRRSKGGLYGVIVEIKSFGEDWNGPDRGRSALHDRAGRGVQDVHHAGPLVRHVQMAIGHRRHAARKVAHRRLPSHRRRSRRQVQGFDRAARVVGDVQCRSVRGQREADRLDPDRDAVGLGPGSAVNHRDRTPGPVRNIDGIVRPDRDPRRALPDCNARDDGLRDRIDHDQSVVIGAHCIQELAVHRGRQRPVGRPADLGHDALRLPAPGHQNHREHERPQRASLVQP